MPLKNPVDQQALAAAAAALENPGFLIELASWIGRPIEASIEKLPSRVSNKINAMSVKALQTALRVSLSSMSLRERTAPSRLLHKVGVTVTGGVGGAFGLAAMAVELPVSTTIMLRSIADIARAEGEDLEQAEARLACLEVFGLGGKSEGQEAAEAGYFAARLALRRVMVEAAAFAAQKSAVRETSAVMVRLVSKISQRFAPAVAEKFAAQAVPVIGAMGGAALNLVFMNHFQRTAQGHFIIRRLERRWGQSQVQMAYEELARRQSA